MGIGRDQEIAPTEEGGFLSNKSRDREIAPTEERSAVSDCLKRDLQDL